MAKKPWISVQLEEEMKRDLDEYCNEHDISRSELIRSFINRMLYENMR